MVRDCTKALVSTAPKVCLRCGRDDCGCAGLGDYARFEGGCSKGYLFRDLYDVRCCVCFRIGHLCCKETSTVSRWVARCGEYENEQTRCKIGCALALLCDPSCCVRCEPRVLRKYSRWLEIL